MANAPDRFSDYTARCPGKTGETEEQTYQQPDGTTVTTEIDVRCETEVTFDNHYIGMKHVEGYDGKVHVLKCPDCGETVEICPVCTGEDGAPGWYRGETTGDMLACHVCNHREYVAQRRDPMRPA